MKKLSLTLTFILFILFSFLHFPVYADDIYQSTEQFIHRAFNPQSSQLEIKPEVKALWLTAEDKKIIADIMSHSFNKLRVHYWQHNNETVWIIDEIGKEKPITIGVHIKEKQIAELKVLTYRESRGDEVRHKFFTIQFDNAQLDQENNLTQHIDGITGATLSVRALTKVARLALWLNNKAQQ